MDYRKTSRFDQNQTMKLICLFFISLLTISTYSQDFTFQNFEQEVIDYRPEKPDHLSQKDFDYAAMILGQTRKATKENPDNFNVADYFNVLSAFLTLKQDKAAAEMAFLKFKLSDGSCEYAEHLKSSIDSNDKYKGLRKAFDELREECARTAKTEDPFDLESYCEEYSLDIQLVKIIAEIDELDQRHRQPSSKDMDKQRELDEKSQKLIGVLQQQYGGYIGRSLVGPKFETVMWSVIQHSDIYSMEHGLPLVHEAVSNGELPQGPLEMLLDRLYGLKHGYQFFGTQHGFGFELATEEQRKAIIDKYDLK